MGSVDGEIGVRNAGAKIGEGGGRIGGGGSGGGAGGGGAGDSSVLSGSAAMMSEEVEVAIVRQVEFYLSKANLSRDYYLVQKMSADLWVGLDVIAEFPKMKYLGVNDVSWLARVLHERSKLVEVNVNRLEVRPSYVATEKKRSILILREIPSTTPEAEIRQIFEDVEGCPPVFSVKTDVEDTWFVTFDAEDGARNAFECTKTQTFRGSPIKARVKNNSRLSALSAQFPDPTTTTPADVGVQAAAFLQQQQQRQPQTPPSLPLQPQLPAQQPPSQAQQPTSPFFQQQPSFFPQFAFPASFVDPNSPITSPVPGPPIPQRRGSRSSSAGPGVSSVRSSSASSRPSGHSSGHLAGGGGAGSVSPGAGSAGGIPAASTEREKAGGGAPGERGGPGSGGGGGGGSLGGERGPGGAGPRGSGGGPTARLARSNPAKINRGKAKRKGGSDNGDAKSSDGVTAEKPRPDLNFSTTNFPPLRGEDDGKRSTAGQVLPGTGGTAAASLLTAGSVNGGASTAATTTTTTSATSSVSGDSPTGNGGEEEEKPTSNVSHSEQGTTTVSPAPPVANGVGKTYASIVLTAKPAKPILSPKTPNMSGGNAPTLSGASGPPMHAAHPNSSATPGDGGNDAPVPRNPNTMSRENSSMRRSKPSPTKSGSDHHQHHHHHPHHHNQQQHPPPQQPQQQQQQQHQQQAQQQQQQQQQHSQQGDKQVPTQEKNPERNDPTQPQESPTSNASAEDTSSSRVSSVWKKLPKSVMEAPSKTPTTVPKQ